MTNELKHYGKINTPERRKAVDDLNKALNGEK